MIQQGPQGLPGGTLVQEGREHQRDSVLHFLVRVLGHHARRVALQTGGQRQRQVAAFGLVEQAEAPAQGVHLDLGDGALEAEQQAPVRGAGVVNPVAIGDQAVVIAAQVEQRVPVGAVARQPGDFPRQDQTDLAQRDAADQVGEALAVRRTPGGEAEVGVDHLDIALIPAQLDGALAQGVLQAGALLVGQDLVRGRLAHVDHGLAAEMVRARAPRSLITSPSALARSSAMARR